MSNNPPIITRAISVNAPWSWALVAQLTPGFAVKPIENRTWHTPFVGPLAVHSGSAMRHCNLDTVAFIYGACPTIIPQVWDSEAIDDENPLLYFGAIIGACDLIGCIAYNPAKDDFDEVCRAAGFGDWLDRHNAANQKIGAAPVAYWADGPYCLLLDSPRQFSQPIPSKGRLFIYRLDPAEIMAVAKAMRSPLGCPVEYMAKIRAAEAKADPVANFAKQPTKQPARKSSRTKAAAK